MDTPIKEPEKKVSEVPDNETEYEFDEERQIVVHCRYNSSGLTNQKIRIWKTTFLIDPVTKFKSNLLFAYNISFYPIWDVLPLNTCRKFTLVFGKLPKSCIVFDLIEEVDGTGAFESKGILRNKEDIYSVVFH